MRVCERPLVRIPDAGLYQYEYLTNSVWYMITTMATVGYGDFYPHTHIGRIVCGLLILWSIVIVSLMVVVMNNTFSMEQSTIFSYSRGAKGNVPAQQALAEGEPPSYSFRPDQDAL